jgi:hypothetical protein
VIGTTLNQRFTLDKELGRGGMGAVYRATDQVLQRTVAIKVLKDQGEEVGKRIRLEAQILARLLHDNVVRLYDFGESNGTSFLVMEEVNGTSYLKRWRSLPLVERLRVSAQVADALDYAHHQGVIHRDVKPANVLMTAVDQPKLSDFGLSMTAEQTDDSGMIRGTPHYMSPEQARGKRLDHRTDLYALGVMLYENAVGSVPFSGKALEILAHHMNDAPERIRARNPEISENLEALIFQLLEKHPEHRPSSGAAVARALRDEIERIQSPDSARAAMPAGAAPTEAFSPSVAPVNHASARATLPAATTVPEAAPPLAKELLRAIVAEPMILTPNERYLCGHYLAYLLGGSRRKGILLRRPLDPRNADRARLVLAMTWIMLQNATEDAVARGAKLLEEKPDVRPSLSPIVVAKYLASRDSPGKRKRFRQARKQLLEASPYAQAHLTDPNGVLNPGLIPAELNDLRKIARVAEVWRTNAEFRNAILMYATLNAAKDPASFDLWPEVVYPLIERARWQRQSRTRAEALWDNLCARVLHVPDAGVRVDRAIQRSVPAQVADELDVSLDAFEEEPVLEADAPPADETDRITVGIRPGSVNLDEIASERAAGDKGMVMLATPDPHRFLLGELRTLWQEALAAMRAPGAKAGHRRVPVGPYRLAVIPSVRGRSAGQIAIQGMTNKQVEMLTPSMRASGSASKPIVAVWVYEDNSLAITYLDFKGNECFILWHAPNAQQFNFSDAGALNHMLYHLGMEVPDQIHKALSKSFRPSNRV